jgi:hypothetical protein
MAKARRDTETLDLLSWEPPQTAVRFDEGDVRGATIGARYCRAMALALKECGKSREEVAKEMGKYLGVTVSKQMLDAYVSEARDTHTINVTRFAALVHATKDFRLLSIIPELFGFSVIEKRYEDWIIAAMAKDKAEELNRMADAALRRAKGSRP